MTKETIIFIILHAKTPGHYTNRNFHKASLKLANFNRFTFPESFFLSSFPNSQKF